MKTLLASCALLCAALPSQNQALSFTNGSADNHFDVGYAPGLLPRRSITVEAWVTYDDSTVPVGQGFRWPTIARQDVAPGGESWFLRVGAANNGGRNLEWACHNGSFLQFTTYTFTPGEFSNWTHIAATYDTSVATLYVNGQQVAQRAVSGPMRDNQGLLRVGNGDVSTGGNEVWNGEIDELRIWPFARTQAEIQASIDDEMGFVPGAITFHLDGDLFDSSSSFVGTPNGTMNYVSGASSDPWTLMNVVAFGTPTTTCAQTLGITGSSRPVGGSMDFSLVAYDGSPNVQGGLVISARSSVTPLVVLGVDFWLDPTRLLPNQISTMTDASGVARARINLPANPALNGATLVGQFAFLDSSCGPQGLSATPAAGVVLQF